MKIVFKARSFDNKFEQSTYIHSTPNLGKSEFEIDNSVFLTTLQYFGYVRGRSSLNVEWLDTQTDYVYYSTMKVLDDALLQGKIQGNKLTGKFTFYQQGQAILLKQII